MPTEISTINTTSTSASLVRQNTPASTVGRQAAVTNGQNLPPVPGQAVTDQASSVVSEDAEIERAVSDINAYVQNVSRELQFSIEEELPLGRAVIRVIDAETEEVIREIPSKEVLAIAERLEELNESISGEETVKGLIIRAQA